HSLSEVARLATDMVILSEGRVTASGPVREVMQRLDLMPQGEVDEGGAVIDAVLTTHDEAAGLSRLRSGAGQWRLAKVDAPVGSPVRIRIRARDVMIATEEPRGLSAINILSGRIVDISEGSGAEALVRIDCGGDILVSRVTRYSVRQLALASGKEVHAIIKAVSFDRSNVGRGVPMASVR
ncbi:MAG: TOBE domain-containing protein, partial [Parvibaculaceae bacterium]